MNRILISVALVVSFLSSSSAFANRAAQQSPQEDKIAPIVSKNRELEISATSLERKRKGYGKYPVVQCAGVKAKYLELLSQLDSIQERIKKEACPADEQDKIKSELSNLTKLAGEERTTFVDIIKKGMGASAELSPEDLTKVRTYISTIVKSAAVVTGLTKNSACFDEEGKNLSLATLASMISEVSGSLGAITGPLGAKINLGGKLAAGLIESVGAIIKARETYCKSTGFLNLGACTYSPSDEQAFVSSLCAYYQFKTDVDEVTNPENRMLEIGELLRETSEQMQLFATKCPECKAIIADFNQATGRTKNMQETVTFTYKPPHQESFQTLTKPLAEITYQELLDVYAQEIADSEQNYYIKEGRKSPAYYVVRTLRTHTWAESELVRVTRETYEDDPDVALHQVRHEQNRIEEFLFEDEAPKYINFASQRAKKAVPEFMFMVWDGRRKVSAIERNAALQPDPNRQYADNNYGPASNGYLSTPGSTADNIHDIFRHEVEFLNGVTDSLDDAAIKAKRHKVESYLASLRLRIMGDLKDLKRKYAIFRDYCRLFEYGKLRYDGPVSYECAEGHERDLTDLKELFAKVENTLLGEYANEFSERMKEIADITGDDDLKYLGTIFSDVNGEAPSFTRDWVGSLTRFIADQNQYVDTIIVPKGAAQGVDSIPKDTLGSDFYQ